MSPWREEKELPTLDLFTRSISAGPSVTELFPGLSTSRAKPNLVARYYIDDERMVARREAIKKIMADQEEFDKAKVARREAIKKIMADQEDLEKAREVKSEAEERSTENQRKPRPSGSNSGLGTPKRRNNRMAPIMGNSPKINEYFSKGAIKDTVKSDTKEEQEGEKYKKENRLVVAKDVTNLRERSYMTKVGEVKPEHENKSVVAINMTTDMTAMHEKPIKTGKDEVKYEQEEELGRDMKMYPGAASMHEKPVKKEEDQEDMTVPREYSEEYSKYESRQEEEESKQEAEDLPYDELMQMENTDTAPEEVPMPMDMLTAERANEKESEQEEPGKEDQMSVREREEVETQEVNTIEVHTRSST